MTCIATAVMATPRQEPTLRITLDSLAVAGLRQPFVFGNPGTDWSQADGSGYYEWSMHCRPSRAGVKSLVTLSIMHPEADAYVLCQDDAVMAKGAFGYLQGIGSGGLPAMWSLYEPKNTLSPQDSGFAPIPAERFIGAVAIMLNRSAMELLKPHASPGDKLFRGAGFDYALRSWAVENGVQALRHHPSLVLHIGRLSTLQDGADASGSRQCERWIEDVERWQATGETAEPMTAVERILGKVTAWTGASQ